MERSLGVKKRVRRHSGVTCGLTCAHRSPTFVNRCSICAYRSWSPAWARGPKRPTCFVLLNSFQNVSCLGVNFLVVYVTDRCLIVFEMEVIEFDTFLIFFSIYPLNLAFSIISLSSFSYFIDYQIVYESLRSKITNLGTKRSKVVKRIYWLIAHLKAVIVIK